MNRKEETFCQLPEEGLLVFWTLEKLVYFFSVDVLCNACHEKGGAGSI